MVQWSFARLNTSLSSSKNLPFIFENLHPPSPNFTELHRTQSIFTPPDLHDPDQNEKREHPQLQPQTAGQDRRKPKGRVPSVRFWSVSDDRKTSMILDDSWI